METCLKTLSFNALQSKMILAAGTPFHQWLPMPADLRFHINGEIVLATAHTACYASLLFELAGLE